MRLKVVVAILLLAVGFLGVIALVSKALRPPSTSSSAASENVPPVTAVPTSPVTTVPASPATARANDLPPVASVVPVTTTNAAPVADTNAIAAHAQYVSQRIKELNDLAMNDDMESRDAILSELKDNPDKAVRAAALEAAIQFGDRSVVPAMQEVAAQTQDPEEKAKILEAIDYINLPSLSEYLAANTNSTPGSAPGYPPSHVQSPTQSADSGQPSPGSGQ
jgi:hypothetical protein